MYIYRVTSDIGFALCVDNGMFLLASCKGRWKNGVKTGIRNWIGSKKDDFPRNWEAKKLIGSDNVEKIWDYHRRKCKEDWIERYDTKWRGQWLRKMLSDK